MLTSPESSDYFRHARREIVPLLPASATAILDVGAGAGMTSAWLRARYPGSRTTALEGTAALRDDLVRHVDHPFIVDLDGALPDIGSPDLILFLDVLEHLRAPGDVLQRLTSTMAEGATVIVSLPNVAHASVSVPLLLRGRFDYQDSGILDRTHLHFFVRRTAIELLNRSGLVVRRGIRSGLRGPRARALDTLTGGLLRDQLTKQYIMAATRGTQQGRVEWLVA